MSGNNIYLRQSTNNDLPTLAKLRWDLCSDDGATEQNSDKEYFTEQFLQQAEKLATTGNLIHFVAENDVHIIGVISLFLVNKMPSPSEIFGYWGYVTNVYVKPDHRNIGVGKKLLNYVKNYAKEHNYELLIVWPSERSYPFYKREGFKNANREQDPLVLVL